MIYIEKEGLPDKLNGKIIELRKSNNWKSIKEGDTDAVRRFFDNDFPKNEVKSVLIHEQRGLCAYCMRRIHMDAHSRVEHLIPLSKDKEKAIDYNNMLGVCDGGERIVGQRGHILCCDANKKEKEISISPFNQIQMNKIAYKPDGTVFTEPRDEDMENDINETLLLNGIRKSDGSIIDTSTEILKGRRDAYDRARRMMESLNKSGKCSSIHLKKIMDNLKNTEEREEYVGVKLYYFNKKYKTLVSRGL